MKIFKLMTAASLVIHTAVFATDEPFSLQVLRSGEGKITKDTKFSGRFLPLNEPEMVPEGTFTPLPNFTRVGKDKAAKRLGVTEYMEIEKSLLGSFKFDKKDFPIRLKNLPIDQRLEAEVTHIKTWDTSKFTQLRNLKKGQKLSSWKLNVHGLEIQHMPEITLNTSEHLDVFVKEYLNRNPKIPEGIEFIPYYAYYFLQKTVVSGSIASSSNPSTFGKSGFIVDCPPENLIYTSSFDAKTPTDYTFYQRNQVGKLQMILGLSRFRIYPLDQISPMKATGKEESRYISSYNEIAYLPTTEDQSSISITGIFFRTSSDKLEDFLGRKENKLLMNLAEHFDLPVVHINEDTFHTTDII